MSAIFRGVQLFVGVTPSVRSVDDVLRIAGGMNVLLPAIEELRSIVPAPSDIERVHQEHVRSYSAARELLGDIPASLLTADLAPALLDEIAAILGQADRIRCTPLWLWREPTSGDDVPAPESTLERARCLLIDPIRSRFRVAFATLDSIGGDAKLLSVISVPSPADDPLQHIESELRDAHRRRVSLQNASGEHEEWIRSSNGEGIETAAILDLIQTLEGTRDLMGRDIYLAILEQVRTAGDHATRKALGELHLDAALALEKAFGSVTKTFTVDMYEGWFKNRRGQRTGESRPHVEFRFEHDWLKRGQGRASLKFSPYADAARKPYGAIRLPVRIWASQRPVGEFAIVSKSRSERGSGRTGRTAGSSLSVRHPHQRERMA